LGKPSASILNVDFTQKIWEAYSSARLANFYKDCFILKIKAAGSKEIQIDLHQTT
jgi:hypothetical protein